MRTQPFGALFLTRRSSSALPPPCRRFLLTPGPADRPLNCKILRSGGGLLKGGPQYTLLVEQEGGRNGAFLLAARKRKGGPGGAAYVLSVGARARRGRAAGTTQAHPALSCWVILCQASCPLLMCRCIAEIMST